MGPCTFRLDNPHRSQIIFTDTPVIRVHSFYKCASEVAYVNAQVQLRFCGPVPTTPAAACPVVGSDQKSHVLNINYGNNWGAPFTTSDSDPYPESGYYVATAIYEVCVLGGQLYPGTAQSPVAYFDAATGKVQFLRDISGTEE